MQFTNMKTRFLDLLILRKLHWLINVWKVNEWISIWVMNVQKYIYSNNKQKQSFLFLLSWEQGHEGDTLDGNDFESDTRNITFGSTLLTETSNEDLVVFSQIVETTVPWNEGSNLLTVLLEHDSDSLSDGGVGLFWLYTDLFYDESLGHTWAHEGVFESWAEKSFIEIFVGPSEISDMFTFEVFLWFWVYDLL